MRYLSVCSGIEAATVAWHPLGWEPFAFSEIEKFPSAVLAHHWPDVPNLGDMQNHEQWPEADIDVLVGGTPCQSFSVAGLRQGMADPRGNLALVYLAIAAQYRPRWLVWENVPGVLSSNGGRDFGAILGGMVELGYGIAYRVLDAQYFGVPQRRRRVFVVGYLGDWRRAAEVLFEPESLRRDPPPRRETGEDATGTLTAGAGSRRGAGQEPELMVPEGAVTHSLRGEGFDASEDGTGRGTPLVPEVANPLTARMHKGINTTADEGQTPIVEYCFHPTQDPIPSDDGSCHALGAGSRQGCATAAIAFAQNQRDEVRLMDKAGALASEPGAKQRTYVAQVAGTLKQAGKVSGAENGAEVCDKLVASAMAVRRLTPLECERLQGFPDRYTDIPKASDSARYKALGNSMAVPVMAWIGARIQRILTTGGSDDK